MSSSCFYKWLFGAEKSSELSRNAHLVLLLYGGRDMWVEFVVCFLPCSEVPSPGFRRFSLHENVNILKSQFNL